MTVVIRPLQDSDADALHAVVQASMASLSQWLPWATPAYALTDAQAWIAFARQARESGSAHHFGVFDAGSGALLGGVGINHLIPAYRTGHMGYWVADAARGRGVAGEASRLAARFAFDTLGLQRLTILIHPQNRASLRVAIKLGGVCEGLARNVIVVGGESAEAFVYSLIPDDFAADDLAPDDLSPDDLAN